MPPNLLGHSVDRQQFMESNILQASVATFLRYDVIFNDYGISNFLLNVPVRELWMEVGSVFCRDMVRTKIIIACFFLFSQFAESHYSNF